MYLKFQIVLKSFKSSFKVRSVLDERRSCPAHLMADGPVRAALEATPREDEAETEDENETEDETEGPAPPAFLRVA